MSLRRMRCTEHVACIWEMNANKTGMEKENGRYRLRMEVNIKTAHTEKTVQSNDGTQMTRCTVQWWDFVNTVMNLRLP
jgi:hypothetical protein